MNIVGIIPARMGSTRFPNKPLAKLHGIPMVGHCYYRTSIALDRSTTFVATCDQEIVDYMNSINGNVVMTANTHKRATTRSAEAVEIIEQTTGNKVDVVVMIQGDEPLIQPHDIQEALNQFADPSVNIVNLMTGIDSTDAFIDKNNVKVVVNNNNDALYFSREPIPSLWLKRDGRLGFMQTGIILFRREMLVEFNKMEETPLEVSESIDMNRVLENGGTVRMVYSESELVGVDTLADLSLAEAKLQNDQTLQLYIDS